MRYFTTSLHFLVKCLVYHDVDLLFEITDVTPEVEYVLNFDSPAYVCLDESSSVYVDTSGMDMITYNETTSCMTGAIKFLQGLDENVMIEAIVEKEVSGQFEMMATHIICDLCEELHPDSNYYKYLQYFGFPATCPFDAGEYSVHDFVINTDDLPVNSANAARYQVTVNFYNNPDCSSKDVMQFLFCLKLDFIIEPK
ncbi:uncharacterized protein LOC131845433 [Achroia grisella]|uniref:uncharacterized protein LOC131845433 n=1 Tax=Achroia grisella TaxID=688607 RepID=UPI0027D202CF|nr:uncharacterized protein LOC131845433 [Achroia grisella]